MKRLYIRLVGLLIGGALILSTNLTATFAAGSFRVLRASCDNVLVRGTSERASVDVELDSLDNGPWVIGVATATVTRGHFLVSVPFFHPPFPTGTHVLVKVSERQGNDLILLGQYRATVSCDVRPSATVVSATINAVTVQGVTNKRFVAVEIDNLSTNGWVVGWQHVQITGSKFTLTTPYFYPPFPVGTVLRVKVSTGDGNPNQLTLIKQFTVTITG